MLITKVADFAPKVFNILFWIVLIIAGIGFVIQLFVVLGALFNYGPSMLMMIAPAAIIQLLVYAFIIVATGLIAVFFDNRAILLRIDQSLAQMARGNAHSSTPKYQPPKNKTTKAQAKVEPKFEQDYADKNNQQFKIKLRTDGGGILTETVFASTEAEAISKSKHLKDIESKMDRVIEVTKKT